MLIIVAAGDFQSCKDQRPLPDRAKDRFRPILDSVDSSVELPCLDILDRLLCGKPDAPPPGPGAAPALAAPLRPHGAVVPVPGPALFRGGAIWLIRTGAEVSGALAFAV